MTQAPTDRPHRGPVREADITALYPMVRRIALKFPPCASYDDLTQIGMEAVCRSAGRFDSSRGNTFAAYAHRRAWGAMQDHIRTEHHTRTVGPIVRLVSLDAPAPESGDPFEELLHAPDTYPDPFVRGALIGAVAALPDRQRRAVLLLIEGFSQREIADDIGVTESAVSHWLRKARAAIASHPVLKEAV